MIHSDAPLGGGSRDVWRRRLLLASRLAFAGAWIIASLSPWWTQGLFAWPSLGVLRLAGHAYSVGPAALLPALAAASGILALALSRGAPLFKREILIPLGPTLAFGLLALFRSWPVHRADVLLVTSLGLLAFWGTYAYAALIWSPGWTWATLAVILVAQGAVALAQFARQGSVGLVLFGELALDPAVRGVSVVQLADRRWLRAYGLTAHPNVLGGYLALGMLVCTGAWLGAPRRRWPLLVAVALAGGALMASFSRSAWLGFVTGLMYLALATRIRQRIIRRGRILGWALFGLGLVGLVLWLGFGELFAARLWGLGSTLERNSLQERWRDIGQAWMLIQQRPWLGVGTGYYVDALWAWAEATGREFPAFQPVHNVPLLAAAEMGIAGGLIWLWLVLALPVAVACRAHRRPAAAHVAGWAASLVAVAVVSLLDNYPYFFSSWWMAVHLGVLLGAYPRLVASEAGR